MFKSFDALEKAFNEGGKKEYWQQKLAFATPKTGKEHWMRMAAIHARLTQPDNVFEYLRQARLKTPVSFSKGLYTNPNFTGLWAGSAVSGVGGRALAFQMNSLRPAGF